MPPQSLGRLRKVDLRQVWTSEPGGFTPWLAQEENLKLLGDTIGIELELESQEKAVGPFRADILCKDTATDQWVLIENQLERTDHTHLGKLMAYAAGLQAVTIVWIAQRFTEEHRAALDWLNEKTDDQINLFGLEIELWQIGESPVAPKFNVVSQPNEWTRTVHQSVSNSQPVSEHRQLQLKFWTVFRQFMESKNSPIRCQKPAPQNWTNHPLGRSGIYLSSVLSLWNTETGLRGPEIRADVTFSSANARQDFEKVKKQQREIESQLSFTLTWVNNPENRTTCRIFTRENADFLNESLWPKQMEWLREKQEALYRVFSPIVRQLREDGAEAASEETGES